MDKRKKIIMTILVIIGIFVICGIVFISYFIYSNKTKNNEISSMPIKKAKPQTLVEQVSKLVELPKDEIPTITTVTDVAKLSSQPLFKNAKNGDRVLIYTRSGIAIIYRPSTNKIIEYSNVDLIK